jgi:hypothetical protein
MNSITDLQSRILVSEWEHEAPSRLFFFLPLLKCSIHQAIFSSWCPLLNKKLCLSPFCQLIHKDDLNAWDAITTLVSLLIACNCGGFTTSLYHHIAIPPHCYITTSLYHHIVISPHRYIPTSLYPHIAISPHCYITTTPM